MHIRSMYSSAALAMLASLAPAAAEAQTVNTLFPQLATLTASDGQPYDGFGNAVAIDGDTMVVGVPYDDVGWGFNQGSVHVFVRSGSMWTLQATLTASEGQSAAFFGSSVAISGDTIAVGVPYNDLGANSDQGSVRVFTRIGTTWAAQAALTAAEGASLDFFGESVAISGDTIAVGVRYDDLGANSDQGSVRVFTRSGTVWTEQTTLTASDGAAFDEFGESVAISGDTIAVGARLDDVGANFDQGSVRVFTRSGASWTTQATLTAPDGAWGDRFGESVAISGDMIAVGVPYDDIGGIPDPGSVRVYVRSGSAWTLQATVTASDGAGIDYFGSAVAISGDTMVVGVESDDVGTNENQGSVRVFTRSGTAWTAQATLTASDGAVLDLFGKSIAISGDTIAVGMPSDDLVSGGVTKTDQGSVRVFGNHRALNQTTGVYSSSLANAIATSATGDRLVVGDAALSQSVGLIDASQKRLTFVGVEPMTLGAGALLNLANNSAFVRSLDVPAAGLTVAGKLSAPQNGTLTLDQISVGGGGQLLQRGSTILVIQEFSTASGGVSYLDGPILAEGVSTAVGGQHRVSANTDVFSNYTNAGTTIVQRGILYIYGTLVNTGTMTGQVNNGLLPPSPGDGFAIGGDHSVAADSSLTLPDPAWWLRVGGSLDIAIDDPARFDMGVATIEMSGAGEAQSLEVFGRDDGAVDTGFAASNYLVGALRVRAGATVELVDNHNNASGKGGEAIYANELVVAKGATLVTNGYKVYTRAATIAGAVSNPADVVVVEGGDACPGDIYEDGVVNSADLGILLSAWGACGGGECPADINNDGQVDSADLGELLSGWGPCAN